MAGAAGAASGASGAVGKSSMKFGGLPRQVVHPFAIGFVIVYPAIVFLTAGRGGAAQMDRQFPASRS